MVTTTELHNFSLSQHKSRIAPFEPRFEKAKAISPASHDQASPDRASPDRASPDRASPDRESLVILDPRALDRQCLASALAEHEIGMSVVAMSSMEEWREKKAKYSALGAILYNLGSRKLTDSGIPDELKRITSEFKAAPLVVLADTEDLSQILIALECGARGYIPSSVGIDVCVEAINLAVAGGIFVPASSVLAMRHLIDAGASEARSFTGMFTQRQAEVAQALRRGKANKIIAYELQLRESTIKVHIRNIMKKLNATNRTEVAFKLNDLFIEGDSTPG